MTSQYPAKITHKELVDLGRDWLIRPFAACAPYGHSGCGVVLTEITTAALEQPDVLGFSGRLSILIECKTSRSDFNADKNKSFRQDPEVGVGAQRWYLAPKGIIPIDALPPKWGLLEVLPGRSILMTRRAEAQKRDTYAEIVILTSVLRRLNIYPDSHVAIKKYEIQSTKNRATFFIQEEIDNKNEVEANHENING